MLPIEPPAVDDTAEDQHTDEGRFGDETRVDVVLYPSGEVKAVPAGKGAEVVRSYRERGRNTGGLRFVVTWVLVLAILGYSLLVVRSALVGLIAATLVYAVSRLLPRFTGTDADLFDAGVTLRDAREQWEAEPVSELEPPARGADRRREREHAFE